MLAVPKESDSCAAYPSDAHEKIYISTRNRYIDQFRVAAASHEVDLYEKEKNPLIELEKLLIQAIGCVNINDFPKQGKINISLVPDAIYGRVDGLMYNANRISLFVTTEGLVRNFFAGYQKFLMGNTPPPENAEELSKIESFYQAVFSPNAAVMRYAEIPVTSPKGTTVYAFLGITTQMDGLLEPSEIFVFVKKKNRILMVYDRSKTWSTIIPKCLEEKDRMSEQLIETGGAYLRCYEREARTQPFFTRIQRHVQRHVQTIVVDSP